MTCLLQVGLARAIGGTLAIADVASGGGKAESPEADKAAGAQSITTTPPAAPLSPSGEPFSDALNDAERQLTVPEIQSIQTRLGMRNEQISGRIDGETRSAIRDWQGRQGFANTGILTPTEIY
ncbi:MAG: peptidoglycan-binding protein, partial [Candidatus Accumulibacter sp.]|nr:peptidoglycan-binding protein [Accumulibacter sp.]